MRPSKRAFAVLLAIALQGCSSAGPIPGLSLLPGWDEAAEEPTAASATEPRAEVAPVPPVTAKPLIDASSLEIEGLHLGMKVDEAVDVLIDHGWRSQAAPRSGWVKGLSGITLAFKDGDLAEVESSRTLETATEATEEIRASCARVGGVMAPSTGCLASFGRTRYSAALSEGGAADRRDGWVGGGVEIIQRLTLAKDEVGVPG